MKKVDSVRNIIIFQLPQEYIIRGELPYPEPPCEQLGKNRCVSGEGLHRGMTEEERAGLGLQTGGLNYRPQRGGSDNGNLFLTAPEVGSPRSGCRRGEALMRTLPIVQIDPVCYVLKWQGDRQR